MYDLTIPDVTFATNFPLFERIERNPAPMTNDPLLRYRGLNQACEHVLSHMITADTDLSAMPPPYCWKCGSTMQHFAQVGPASSVVIDLQLPGTWKRHGWRCEPCGVALNWSNRMPEVE